MAKVKGAMLAAALAAAALAACSRAEPVPRDFILAEPPATDGTKVPETMAAAAAFCKEETRVKGIKSVAAIFSRLRPGKVDEDYIACMKRRGFEVPQ